MGVSLGHAFEAGLPTARESLGRLRAMSYVELKSLPPHGTVELADLGRRVTLTTYRDVLGSEVQVVVQLVAHGRLGFSKIWLAVSALRRAVGIATSGRTNSMNIRRWRS
jgi:hypothetical protein